MNNNRRNFLKKSASLAAAASVAGLSGFAAAGETEEKITKVISQKNIEWPIADNPNTPKHETITAMMANRFMIRARVISAL